MSTATLTIMNRLKGEVLLEGSHILTQIETLKQGLRYKTDDKYVSFDDHFLYLQAEIDKIQRIALQDEITARQGARYENELLDALGEIQDQVEKWTIKVVRFQGDLVSAKEDVTELASAFEAWYFVAATELLTASEVKLPVQNIKALASSEFNRLIERSNLSINALIEAVKIELKRLDSKRKMAKQKFEMGQAQVNASWANMLPESLGHLPDAPRFNLLKSSVIEEDPEEMPSFVSRSGEVKKGVTPNPDFDDEPEMMTATISDHEELGYEDENIVYPGDMTRPLATFCAECNEPQFECPAGANCPNGHGGAAALDEPRKLVTEGTEDGWGHSGQDDSVDGLARDMHGMFAGTDKHEQAVATFEEQQLEEKLVSAASPAIPVTEEATPPAAAAKNTNFDDFDDFDDAPTPPKVTAIDEQRADPAPTTVVSVEVGEEWSEPGPIDRVIAKADPNGTTSKRGPSSLIPELDEFKGTFRKEIVSGPVEVLGEGQIAERMTEAWRPLSEYQSPEPETPLDLSKHEIGIDYGSGPDKAVAQRQEEDGSLTTITWEPKPTKRKALNFDDFDLEDTPSQPVPEPVKDEPKPTPTPVAAAPAARKSTAAIFDFDDDELN